jgi:hypothetical protein
MGVAYFNLDDFTGGLDIALDPSLSMDRLFDPADTIDYIVTGAPPFFYLTVTPGSANAAPHDPLVFVDIDSVLLDQDGPNKWKITPHQVISTVHVRVELPYGAASETYTFVVNREGGDAALVLASPPDKTVYRAGESLEQAGLAVNYSSGSGLTPVALAACDIIYNFSKPGNKTVFITYDDSITGTPLYTAFPAWVMGLSSLSVSDPGGYVPALDLDDFPFSSYNPVTHTGVYDLNLGTVPKTVDTLNITVASAITDTEAGASLSITGEGLPVGGISAASGVLAEIPLVPDSNTVTITVRLDKTANGNADNFEARTYTLTVFRIPDLYVSGAGASGTAGSDATGNGSKEKPYATIQKALDKAKTLPLGGISDPEVTIIVSGNVTADAGTTNGMVDISGSGYPHIILKGAPGGGTIDASGTRRVLYIGNGNRVSLGDNLILTGGNISGGGVYVSGGTFTMTGGNIQGNVSNFSVGGGVYVGGGTFIMSGGVIQNNTGNSGGGVYIYSGTFTMSGGVIQNNTASAYGYGGGVYVNNPLAGSTFTKTGGTIAGNPAISPLLPNTASSSGHAVYLNGGGKRNATAGPAVTLYAKYGGGWIYAGGPGIGDTSGNWQ